MNEILIDQLSEVVHRFQLRMREAIQDANIGLTPFEARILVAIARAPGASQQQIALRVGSDKAQITRAIKVLEQKELVSRQTSTQDWRARQLLLTATGSLVMDRLQQIRTAQSEASFAQLHPLDRQHLARILTAIAATP